MESPEVTVVGGGIAGLTAGLTAARLGRSTLVLTGDVLGGHLVSIDMIEGVPGFPEGVPGFDYLPMAEEQAVAAGAVMVSAEATAVERNGEVWNLSTSEGQIETGAAIVATGTRMRSLGVPGEDEFAGKGVSHCASCDAPLLREKSALVVGGGDSAMQEALTLAGSLGSVTLLVRGDALSGQTSFRARLEEHPKIDVRFRSLVEEITGDGSVTGARVRDLDTDSVEHLDADAVFPFVGLDPVSELVASLVRLDVDGRVVTDGLMRTEQSGLLAAGTVRAESVGRAAQAVGDGATAAIAAHTYLTSGVWAEEPVLAR